MNLDLINGEKIVIKSPASLERDPIRHDGELVLTDRRLHFGGIERVSWTYWLDELADVKINSILSVFTHGILVSFQDSFTEIILVHNREGWVAKILEVKAIFQSASKDKDSVQVDDRLSPEGRVKLRMNLEKHFNEDELHSLCADLNVDFENLDGNTKEAKTRELLLWSERTGKLGELLKCCKAERPSEEWDF